MESFVIRIYHRTETDTPDVVGTLESIATGKRTAFHSQAELITLLDADVITKQRKTRRAPAARGMA